MAAFTSGPVPTGNIVKDFHLDNTHVRICDDCCRDRTIEETEQSRRRIERIASEALRAKLLREVQA